MGTRLDLALQKFPVHAEGIRALAERDPSGKLKYLDWSAKVLVSGQALAPEIADVVELFHKFSGGVSGIRLRGRRRNGGIVQLHPDINMYGPQDLTTLRDNLLKLKRTQDCKRRKREKLYRIDGALDAEVVRDAPDLIVRHIKNKQASVHYGLRTKWCIAMLREGYFEDYDAHNATFFFLERKLPLGDEFDKVAIMIARGREIQTEAFTSVDRRVDMISLARVYGSHVFEIFRSIYDVSERYPGSAVARVYAGTATAEQVQATFESTKRERSRNPFVIQDLLVSICCNDAAPFSLLEEVARAAPKLAAAAWKRGSRKGLIRKDRINEWEREIVSAIFIHPSTPADAREAIAKDIRRRHINVDTIVRVESEGRVGVMFGSNRPLRTGLRHGRIRRMLRPNTVKALRARAEMLDRSAARLRDRARRLQKKLTKK